MMMMVMMVMMVMVMMGPRIMVLIRVIHNDDGDDDFSF